MTMFDKLNCFTYAYSAGTIADFYQAVTADAASTNLIDLDAANLNIAGGKPLFLVLQVGTAFATTVSVEVRLQTDTDSGFATAVKDHAVGRWALAALTANTLIHCAALPVMNYQRYLRLYFNVFTNATAGTIFAALSNGPESAVAQVDHVEAAS
jgi:hypothetical protein